MRSLVHRFRNLLKPRLQVLGDDQHRPLLPLQARHRLTQPRDLALKVLAAGAGSN
jgi:hypothetical protein